MEQQSIYRDIAGRTDGDIYVGVVGPVRTGKSTFIKRFMELLVLPNVEEEHKLERMVDELPVGGAGKTIMTTQPKFVPNEAAQIRLRDQAHIRVRLVDCVGYLIRGALGLNEGDGARMVRTPWYDYDIPFENAAELGTRKVIAEHSTIGIVVTTDGTIGEFPRTAYVDAEERVVGELKALSKPFVIVMNTTAPEDPDTAKLQRGLLDKYNVPVVVMDVPNMNIDDVNRLLESVLFEFPIAELKVDMPAWVRALESDHWLSAEIMSGLIAAGSRISHVRDHATLPGAFSDSANIQSAEVVDIDLSRGSVKYRLTLKGGLYYKVLGEASGQEVEGEEHLLKLMAELVTAKREYDRVAEALKSVRETGYGLVAPSMAELSLQQPEIVKQGSRFGVRLRASAPSLHMMRVDIQTEVSPIVGTEQQSEDLIKYLLAEFEADPAGIWDTNMFGKSLNELVREDLSNKLMRMPEDVRMKIKETLQRIINDGSGGVICILL